MTAPITEERVAEISRKLTKAQKAYMSELTSWQAPAVWAAKRWMTFPPLATHRVLISLGLVDRSGQLLPDGLAIRAHLTGDQA